MRKDDTRNIIRNRCMRKTAQEKRLKFAEITSSSKSGRIGHFCKG